MDVGQTEAVRSVNVAVENCTARHKEGEREAAARASETLRRTLEAAADEEKARSQSAFERSEKMCLTVRVIIQCRRGQGHDRVEPGTLACHNLFILLSMKTPLIEGRSIESLTIGDLKISTLTEARVEQ